MNINPVNLRQAVLANLADTTATDLHSTIVDAVQSGEEKTLPGLGVLFELLWRHSSPEQQQEIVQSVHQELQHAVQQ